MGAEDLYTAHLTPLLREAEQTLDTRIQDTQRENRELMDTIQLQREGIARLMGGLENVVQDLEGAVQVMGKDDAVEVLKRETFKMEDELMVDS